MQGKRGGWSAPLERYPHAASEFSVVFRRRHPLVFGECGSELRAGQYVRIKSAALEFVADPCPNIPGGQHEDGVFVHADCGTSGVGAIVAHVEIKSKSPCIRNAHSATEVYAVNHYPRCV